MRCFYFLKSARNLVFIAAMAALHCEPSQAASSEQSKYWPQWRGPEGTGENLQANPPTEWAEDKNVKWKIKLPGHGASTPIVWGNKVFIQAALATGKKSEPAQAQIPTSVALEAQGQAPGSQQSQGQERRQRGPGGRGGGQKPTEFHQFILLCLDRETGKTLWQKTLKEEVPHEGHHQDHGFSSYSPVTDGQVVIAHFGSRGLYGLDLEGNLKWQKDLGRMTIKNSFGEGGSPALHGKYVVINWDHEGDDFIAAFDKNTGNELWRQPRQEDTTWSTPLIVEHAGKAQVITSATKKVRSYDLATGNQIWESPGLTANAIPTAVAGGGIVYVTSGFRGAALFAIKLGRTGDLTGSDAILWSHQKATPYVPSPLLTHGRLYFFSGNTGIFSAFNARTGEVLVDSERLEGLTGVYASPVAAKDKIYLVGRNGTSLVVKHGEKLEVLATNKLDDKIDASPALAGNEIFLRGQQHLVCIAAKK